MTKTETAAALDQKRVSVLHRAGLGGYRPMGEGPAKFADALVEDGLLGRNPSTGIYFLTEKGSNFSR